MSDKVSLPSLDGIDDFIDDFIDEIEEESSGVEQEIKREEKKSGGIIEELEELAREQGELEDIVDDSEDDGIDYDALGITPEKLEELARKTAEWEPPAPKSLDTGMVENEFLISGWVGLLHIDKILTDAIVLGASDVHINTSQVISMTYKGDIVRFPEYHVPDSETMEILINEGLLSHQQKDVLNKNLEYDGSYTIIHGPFAGRRTRINIGLSFGDYFIVFRIINDRIPDLDELGIEDEILSWANYPNGLFLLCGPTGTGKSTTLASVLHHIQKTQDKKIVTIEKPIEYVYPDDYGSLVVQREVGEDTHGFYEGLTSAMRQNPDIIMLGEVRNTEEVTELLRSAETGHLTISTMHTNTVPSTINRIQNLFEGNEQRRIMNTLADTVRGIGNQILVKDVNGDIFAIRELLTVNDEIRDYIIEGDIRKIRDYQERHEITMEHGLAEAYKSGRCTREEIFKHTVNPEYLEKLLSE